MTTDHLWNKETWWVLLALVFCPKTNPSLEVKILCRSRHYVTFTDAKNTTFKALYVGGNFKDHIIAV